jgi:hypothetical protein
MNQNREIEQAAGVQGLPDDEDTRSLKHERDMETKPDGMPASKTDPVFHKGQPDLNTAQGYSSTPFLYIVILAAAAAVVAALYAAV